MPKIRVKKKIGPRDESKVSKGDAGYVYNPETQYTCNVCVWSKDDDNPEETKDCRTMSPTESIKPYGSCIYFNHMDPSKEGTPLLARLATYTKLNLGYAENKKGFSCKRCVNFLFSGDCKKVDKNSDNGLTPGIIHPNACCNLWSADPVRSKMDTQQALEFIEDKLDKK
jgi:hypothetical protein